MPSHAWCRRSAATPERSSHRCRRRSPGCRRARRRPPPHVTQRSWPRSGSPTGRRGRPAATPARSRRLPETITGVPSGNAPTATEVTPSSWPRSGSPTGAPSASRHTRTVPSSAAGDDDRGAVGQRADRHRAPAVVAGAAAPRPGSPSASRHTRTVASPLPETMTGVPSGSAPTATAVTPPSWPRSGSPTGRRRSAATPARSCPCRRTR